MHSRQQKLEAFGQLLDIMDELREKCPWDKKQTLQSLRHLTLEETYELADAIIENNTHEIKKEIGDVLLHLVFYAKIASETHDFDIADVIQSLCEKLIHRHPHIYSDVQVENEAEVKRNWEQLKLKEGKKSILEGVPKALPALIKAFRIQDKVKGIGFDFENETQIWEKIQEELTEYKKAKNETDQEIEFGDLLFSLINYARWVGINPENALEKTNKKFIERFQKMETMAAQQGKNISEFNPNEQNQLWDKAKKQELK